MGFLPRCLPACVQDRSIVDFSAGPTPGRVVHNWLNGLYFYHRESDRLRLAGHDYVQKENALIKIICSRLNSVLED